MFTNLPEVGKPLEQGHIDFLKTFTKSCRKSILEMTLNAQSGHPGGSLSTLDYLALIYAFIISQTGEKVTVSHGHVSPAVYSVLAELGYIDKEDVIKTFRQVGSVFEGHITRHVDGVEYGTGPLGAGVSAGASFALAEKLKKTNKKSFVLMGDGETQEGQVHEMIHFAKHYKLDNMILFIDYNKVQLTASLEETLNIDIKKTFEAGHWNVIEADGHDFQSMWDAIAEAYEDNGKPVVIIGDTFMGQGVDFMEEAGRNLDPAWHGKAPKHEEAAPHMAHFELNEDEKSDLEEFKKFITWTPTPSPYPALLSEVEIDTGTPNVYQADEMIPCRKAYGKALASLGELNKNVLGLTADVGGSVNASAIAAKTPDQFIECGIAEQHMVTTAGGLSLSGYVPFTSTYAVFMSSRAKDQARLNDINYTNVKMVSTHGGLSVGEDGPTHQAIDDMGSFLGMFNTMIIEPSDANQCDRIIRYIASHYGNFYVRMGRHNLPILTKEDGSLYFDENYQYEYGKCERIREGSDITIAAIGTMVSHAFEAQATLKEKGISAELIAVSSIKKFDETLTESIKKTGKVLTVEDHNTFSGLGGQMARHIQKNGLEVDKFEMIGPEKYNLSGKAAALYELNGMDPASIAAKCEEISK
jgi:transketolase